MEYKTGKGHYTDKERKEFVRQYFLSGMNKTAFSKEKNIQRKALYRWINKFGDSVMNEIKEREHSQTPVIKSSDIIEISFTEYSELLSFKYKYEVLKLQTDILHRLITADV